MNNPNPRIGVLLDHHKANMRTKNVLWRFHMRGLKWLQKNWPEERMRRELRGYGPKTSCEWNKIIAAREENGIDVEKKFYGNYVRQQSLEIDKIVIGELKKVAKKISRQCIENYIKS